MVTFLRFGHCVLWPLCRSDLQRAGRGTYHKGRHGWYKCRLSSSSGRLRSIAIEANDRMVTPNPHYAERLEPYRGYLRILASMSVSDKLRTKLDLSGVVQWTLWEASQRQSEPWSSDPLQCKAFLRTILARNLDDEIRKLRRACRDVDREQPLQVNLENSSAQLEQAIARPDLSPSQWYSQKEQALLVSQAIANLPELQREAIVLRYLKQEPIARIAEHLQKSPEAIAGLLKRGLQKLRDSMESEGSA